MTAMTRPVYVEQRTNDRLDKCAAASAAILRDLADHACTRHDAAMLLRLEIEEAGECIVELEAFGRGGAAQERRVAVLRMHLRGAITISGSTVECDCGDRFPADGDGGAAQALHALMMLDATP